MVSEIPAIFRCPIDGAAFDSRLLGGTQKAFAELQGHLRAFHRQLTTAPTRFECPDPKNPFMEVSDAFIRWMFEQAAGLPSSLPYQPWIQVVEFQLAWILNRANPKCPHFYYVQFDSVDGIGSQANPGLQYDFHGVDLAGVHLGGTLSRRVQLQSTIKAVKAASYGGKDEIGGVEEYRDLITGLTLTMSGYV